MGLEALKALQEQLANKEAKSGLGGAIARTPKEMLLDASDVEAKDPDHHYRFVNVTDTQKGQRRIVEGYRVVPEAEGGRTLGGLTLMKIPRKQAEARIARQDELSRRRLDVHNAEMEQAAEGMSRQLRDRHGINVPPERLLVKE